MTESTTTTRTWNLYHATPRSMANHAPTQVIPFRGTLAQAQEHMDILISRDWPASAYTVDDWSPHWRRTGIQERTVWDLNRSRCIAVLRIIAQ